MEECCTASYRNFTRYGTPKYISFRRLELLIHRGLVLGRGAFFVAEINPGESQDTGGILVFMQRHSGGGGGVHICGPHSQTAGAKRDG